MSRQQGWAQLLNDLETATLFHYEFHKSKFVLKTEQVCNLDFFQISY